MYVGTSLFLIAVGAILRWAVTLEVSGFNIQLAGLIILIVGVVGLVISLYLWLGRRPPRDSHPPDEAPTIRRTTTQTTTEYPPTHETPEDYPPPR